MHQRCPALTSRLHPVATRGRTVDVVKRIRLGDTFVDSDDAGTTNLSGIGLAETAEQNIFLGPINTFIGTISVDRVVMTSDPTKKDNVEAMDSSTAMEVVRDTPVYTYTLNGQHGAGFLSTEVPMHSVVCIDDHAAVDYASMNAYLWATVQELLRDKDHDLCLSKRFQKLIMDCLVVFRSLVCVLGMLLLFILITQALAPSHSRMVWDCRTDHYSRGDKEPKKVEPKVVL